MSSKTIDNKVVKMSFDNSNFEKNVKTTMSTLDKLKEKLNFSGASNSLEDVSKAASKVDMSGLSGSLDTVIAKFSSLDVIGATVLSNITTSAMSAASNLVSSVTSAISTGGYTRAINLEQAQHMFEGLGLDVEEAMANANDAVTDTAYGLDAAAMACGQLAASGLELGEDMTNALTAIAGVASMTSSEYSDIADIFTTVASNGKLMSDQLYSLSSRGLNAAAAIAKVLGVTESEVRNMVSEGSISFETFWKSMYLSYADSAKSANETFTGALSNTKAALARIGAKFWTPFISNAKDVLNALMPVINNISSALDPVFEAMESAMEWLNTKLCTFLNNFDLSEVISQFTLTGIATDDAKGALTGLKSLLSIVGQLFSAIGSALGALKPTFVVIINLFLKMANGIGKVITAIDNYLKRTNLLQNVFVTIASGINTVVTAIANWYSEGGGGLSGIANIFTELGASAVDAFGKIVSGFTGLNITKYTSKISSAIRSLGDKAESFTDSMSGTLFPTLKSVFSQLGEIVSDCFNGGITSISDFVNRLANVEVGVNTIGELFEKLGSFVSSIFGGIGSAIGSLFGTDDSGVDNIDSTTETVSNSLDNTTSILDKFKNSLENITNALSPVTDKLGSILSNVASAINDNLGGIISAGILVGVIWLLYRFSLILNNTVNMATAIPGMFRSIGVAIKQMGRAEAMKLMSEALVNIAKAVIELTVALVILSAIDQSKLAGALGSLVVIAGVLAALILVMGKLSTTTMTGTGSVFGIISICAGLYIIAMAFAKLAKIDCDYRDLFSKVMLMVGVLAAMIFLMEEMAYVNTFKTMISSEAMKTLGVSVLAMSAAMLVLAMALQKVADLKIDNIGEFIIKLIAVLYSMKVLGTVAGSGTISNSAGILVTVLSLYLLIGAIKKIVAMDTDSLIAGLGNIVIMFGSLVVLMLVSKLAGQNAAKAGVMIAAVGVALLLIATAMKIVADIPTSKVPYAIATMISIMSMIAILILASAVAGQNAAKAGVMLLAVSAVLIIMAAVIVVLGNMKEESVNKGIKALVAMVACIAVLIIVNGLASKVSANLYKNLIGVTIALAVMAIIIVLLGTMKADKLSGAVAALGIMTICLSALIIVMKIAGKIDSSAIASVVVAAVVVALLAGVLYAMSECEVDNALTNALGLSALLLALSTSCLILSTIKTFSGAAIGTIAILTVVVAALAGILWLIRDLPVESTMTNALALSELLLALSVCCVILEVAGLAGVAALAGVVTLVAVIAAMTGLFAAFAGINQLAHGELSEFLNSGIVIVEQVFTAIGECLGNLVGGILLGITSTLPAVGMNLSLFMANAMPFIVGVKMIDSEAIAGATALAEIMLILGAASILDAIASFFGGDSGVEEFGSSMETLGSGLADFAEKTSGIDDLTGVTNAAEALRIIAEAASEIPNSGGLAGMLFGNNNIGDFITQISESDVGGSLAELSKNSDGIDTSKVKTVAEAIKILATAADEIPNTGGALGALMGNNDIGTFVADLTDNNVAGNLTDLTMRSGRINNSNIQQIGDALVILGTAADSIPNKGGALGVLVGNNNIWDFVTGLTDNNVAGNLTDLTMRSGRIDTGNIQHIADAVSILASVGSEIENTGGALGMLVGNNDIGAFVSDLADNEVGSKLTTLTMTSTRINLTVLQNVADGISALAKVTDGISNEGGLFGAIGEFFTGDNDIGAFLDELVDGKVGSKLTTLTMTSSRINPTVLQNITDGVAVLATVGKGIEKEGGLFDNIGDTLFGDNDVGAFLDEFINDEIAKKLTDISDGASDISVDNINAMSTAVAGLADLCNTLKDIDSSYLSTFAENLDQVGQDGVNSFISNFNTAEARAEIQRVVSEWIYLGIQGANSRRTAIGNAFTDLAALALRKLVLKESSFGTEGKAYVSKIERGVTDNQSSISSAFASAIASSLDTISSYKIRFQNAGSNLVTGFVNGIKSKTSNAEDASSELAQAVLDAITETLDEHSPSKKTEQFGAYAGEGFVTGISDYASAAYSAGSDVADSASSGLSDAISKISDFVSSDLDFTPTITPVLDLSEVKDGASNIGSMLTGTRSLSFAMNTANAISNSIAENQNGSTIDDLLKALEAIGDNMSNTGGNSYTINGVTYDDGSNIANAVNSIVRAARIERRA